MRNSTKISLIIATVLLSLGVVVFVVAMTISSWNFNNLNVSKFKTNTYEVSSEFNDININTDTADVSFLPSTNGKCSVECYEHEKVTHNVSVINGVLTITVTDDRSWVDYLFNFKSDKITVYLPKTEYNSLTVVEDTGDVVVSNGFTFKNLDISVHTGDVKNYANVIEEIKIKTTTGDITVENVTSNFVNLETTTGDITVENVTSNFVNLETTTGDVELKSVTCISDIGITVTTGEIEVEKTTCNNFNSTGDTGEVELSNVIASGKMSIIRSTGDVEFNSIDAFEIYVETDTGDVKGSLLSNKKFVTSTETGEIRVPIVNEGGICEIKTDTGDIRIIVI